MEEINKKTEVGMSKKKKIVLDLIVLIIGIVSLYVYVLNVNAQHKMNDTKTLILSPNAIQIISIDNQYPLSEVCKNINTQQKWGETYNSDGYPISTWIAKGFVDFSQFSKITDDYNGIDYISTFINSPYRIRVKQFDVDGRPMDMAYFDSPVLDRINGNKFFIQFGGVLPTESHVVQAAFTLDSSYNHITSNQVDVTYSIPKLC